MYLDRIKDPDSLKYLNSGQLVELASEIREFLVENVSKRGGHLGPNLGVVELTIAIHRVFDSPRDHIIFDTGHQAYVHKLITGRKDFSLIRDANGISGYPSRNESVHDIVENSHASTALAWADGISRAEFLNGNADCTTVAIIGDGAITGGMAWEALNNLSENPRRPVVVIINDNGRSYAPTIGGLAHHFDALRINHKYTRMFKWGQDKLRRSGKVGNIAYSALHSLKAGFRDLLSSEANLFDSLGIKYIGPVNGHDEVALEFALTRAREYRAPVIVHVITEKGRGYSPAEKDDNDRFHAVGVIHPETGLPLVESRFEWTKVFEDEIVKLAKKDPKIVGITAAMMLPVGIGKFKHEFPERVFDVGIAEQHALTMAAGLAYGGYHPVVAIYATFLNRAYDQILLDVSLHRAGVTLILDRAGITGSDGASHNGMWDIALASTIPRVRLAAPRDEKTLRSCLQTATQIQDQPTILRYPKGSLPACIEPKEEMENFEVLFDLKFNEANEEIVQYQNTDVSNHIENTSLKNSFSIALLGIGPFAHAAIKAAKILSDESQEIENILPESFQCQRITVVDPVWCLPIADDLVRFLADYDVVITMEDGIVDSGFGSLLKSRLIALSDRIHVSNLGIPKVFIDTDNRVDILERYGLTESGFVNHVRSEITALGASNTCTE